MKKIFSTIKTAVPHYFLALILLLNASTITAQSKKIELLDLVKLLSPDSVASQSNTSWTKAMPLTIIKWKSALPKQEGNNYVKRGSASIVVKGKTIKCESVQNGESLCKWDIILWGTKTGYSSFILEADNLQPDKDTDMIDYFFGKNKLKAKLIAKNAESSLYWDYKYLLQIPGQKDIWMDITYENLTATAAQAENNNYTDSFSISFFTDRKNLDISVSN